MDTGSLTFCYHILLLLLFSDVDVHNYGMFNHIQLYFTLHKLVYFVLLAKHHRMVFSIFLLRYDPL